MVSRPDRVVLVPGFTQTAASWDGVVPGLRAAGLVPAAIDVPERESFRATAAALTERGGPGAYVGYSMGGRLALCAALERPASTTALVLVSASPGLADPAERAARSAADEALAAEVEHDGAEVFLARWLAQPMFAGVAPGAPGVVDRRRLTPAFLAHCLRVLGPGAMEPLWDRLRELAMPVAVVTGTDDPKFDAIGDAMAAGIPGCARYRLPGGHALAQESPGALAATIAGFLTPGPASA